MLSDKQGGIKYYFWIFGISWPGIEPRLSGPLVNTLLIRPMTNIKFEILGFHLFCRLSGFLMWFTDKIY